MFATNLCPPSILDVAYVLPNCNISLFIMLFQSDMPDVARFSRFCYKFVSFLCFFDNYVIL
jgi:hypothetical protein